VVDFASPPKVVPDERRRSLVRSEWISEHFNTTSAPAGHGFGLVEPDQEPGFACYSFVPKSGLPLKVIVLDDTQREDDGDVGIHGHGFLDPARLAWLKKELAAGDAANQLMIISAHVPIGVQPINSNFEWWDNSKNLPYLGVQNANTLDDLLAELQSHPNLLLWVSGHLHQNTIKAFAGPTPEQGFWEVQVSSLRDFPQEFRTFELFLNSDYTVSINAIDVDPAVVEGTPAAVSRKYAVADLQIGGNPTIYQAAAQKVDPATQTVDGGLDPTIKPMPTGSYNATLYKQLSPAMKAEMQRLYP
jgi:metallophosphoesterase (TIGR03768 family)